MAYPSPNRERSHQAPIACRRRRRNHLAHPTDLPLFDAAQRRIQENMKIVQRLTVMMLLPAVGSGGRWNGGAGVLDDRDADRGGIHESMRTLPELLDGTIHDTDHGPRQGFASDQEAVASPSSSSSSATLTVGRLLRGGLTFVDALPVDRSTAAKDAKMQAIEDGARRGLFSLTGDATEDTLVWDPDADGGTQTAS